LIELNLNAVLGLMKGQAIKDVVILNPYNEKEFQNDKLSIIDIKATDEAGAFYQIEVQISIYRMAISYEQKPPFIIQNRLD